jgi:hypothetical protein
MCDGGHSYGAPRGPLVRLKNNTDASLLRVCSPVRFRPLHYPELVLSRSWGEFHNPASMTPRARDVTGLYLVLPNLLCGVQQQKGKVFSTRGQHGPLMGLSCPLLYSP